MTIWVDAHLSPAIATFEGIEHDLRQWYGIVG